LYAFFISFVHALYPAHIINFYLIILIITGEKYKL
jgi:hypothetical protein